jgi:hypothetical protein
MHRPSGDACPFAHRSDRRDDLVRLNSDPGQPEACLILAETTAAVRNLDRVLLVEVSCALSECGLGKRVRVQLRAGFLAVVDESR